MKKSKKNLLLLLSLSMSATLFAACGGGGSKDSSSSSAGGNVQGEQLANEAAWAQALSGSAAATNATVEMTMKMEDRAGDMFEKYDGTQSVKVADGKFYGIEAFDASWRFEEDGVLDEDSEHDEDQTYIATVDGVTTVYFKELGNDWQVYPYEEEGRGAFSATVGFILDYCAEFNLDYVGTMYQDFTYNGGTYTFSKTEDGFENTAELKFENGRLVWGKISENGSFSFEGQNATSTYEVSFSISYGGTTIGALPGQEEEPDVELPDTSVEIPETEGAPVANADEWNTIMQNSLAATNATIITMASERDEVMENGIVMVAGGKSYERWTNKDGSTSHTFYGEVEGHSYQFTSDDGENWEITQTDWTPEDYAIVGNELSGLDEMLLFENATWNADKGMYVGTSGEGEFSLKISDGKVVYISFYMESAMMPGVDVVYQIVYGNTAEITLPAMDKEEPELPGGDIEIPDVEGEQLADENAWNAAWERSSSATNFVVEMTENYNGEEDVMFLTAADGKSYMYGEYADGDREYIYYGAVDGKNYEWYSEDGKNWQVEEFYGDIAMVTTPAGLFRGIDQMVSFSDVTYEKGYYSFNYDGVNFRVKFADGYVVEFVHTYLDNEGQACKIAYGNATVGELPPLPQEDEIIGEEIKSAGDWANVIENTQTQTSYTYTVNGRTDREDGKISVMTEYTVVDNGKVYVESETMIHSGTGGAAVSRTRYYQGYVNDVAYEWRDMGDGSYYAQEIESVDITDVVTLFGLDDLDFATASFDSETGAYVFSDSGAIIKVKVVNSLICVMEMEVGAMTVSYVYTYGDASVELPPLTDNEGGEGGDNGGEIIPEIDWDKTLGDDIVGEEVSEDEFYVALERTADAKNFTVRGYAGSSYVNENNIALGVTYVADDKMYNYTAMYMVEDGKTYNSSFSVYIGTVDGTEYIWYSQDGSTYESDYAENQGIAGMCNGNLLLAYLGTGDYSMYTFNAETGAYEMSVEVATDVMIHYTLKIVDGLLVAFTMDSAAEDLDQKFVIEYGTASVGDLPPVGEVGGDVEVFVPVMDWDETLGDDIIGEEVDQAGFDEAIQNTYESQNMTSKQYVDMGNMEVVSAGYFADEKMYSVSTVSGQNGEGTTFTATQYTYAGWVDGVSYAWMSMDGRNWNTMKGEECGLVGYENGAYFSRYLAEFNYGSCTFDEKTGAYVLNTPDDSYQAIKITQGKVCAIIYVMKSEMTNSDGTTSQTTTVERCVIEYGTAEVGELPPVSSGGENSYPITTRPTEAEWDEAFACLLNATNYSMKQMQNVWYYDGSKTIDIISGIKMTETAAWQEMSQTVVTTEGQTNTTNLIVWTNESGTDYQYTFSQENQVWEKSETSVTMDRLFEQISVTFEVFIDMYDVMEWDGARGCFFVPEYTFVTETGEKGNTFYNVCIFIQNHQIIQIDYEMRYAEYEGKMSIYFFDYGMTEVKVPVEGEGYTGNGDENVDNGGDVVIGGEQEDKEEIINGTVTFD